MTSLDIIILLLLGGGAVFGFLRGFVQEILSLLAWALAIAAVWFLYDPVVEFMRGVVATEGGASLLSYAIIFILTFSLGKLGARYIGGKSRSSLLGPIDRVLGFGFGALKGLLVATVFFVLFMIMYETAYPEDERPDWITQSRTYPLLNATSSALVDYIDQRRNPDAEDE